MKKLNASNEKNEKKSTLFLFRFYELKFLNKDYVSVMKILLNIYPVSLIGTEWSSCLKVIRNISSLWSCVEAKVMSDSLFTFNLAPNILFIFKSKLFTFLVIKVWWSFSNDFVISFLSVGHSLLMSITIGDSKESVISIINIKLHWVLVISEQSIVSISQISESTSLIESKIRWKQMKVYLPSRMNFQLGIDSTLVWRNVIWVSKS